jgi:hypothetical protein
VFQPGQRQQAVESGLGNAGVCDVERFKLRQLTDCRESRIRDARPSDIQALEIRPALDRVQSEIGYLLGIQQVQIANLSCGPQMKKAFVRNSGMCQVEPFELRQGCQP